MHEHDTNDTPRDAFDRALGLIQDLPDVLGTKPTTIIDSMPLVGTSQTFIVQTYRQKDEGDRIFLQHVTAEGHRRIVIPAKVAQAIARQRDQLTKRSRSRAAKAAAANGQPKGFAAMTEEQMRTAREKARATRARKAAAKARRSNRQS